MKERSRRTRRTERRSRPTGSALPPRCSPLRQAIGTLARMEARRVLLILVTGLALAACDGGEPGSPESVDVGPSVALSSIPPPTTTSTSVVPASTTTTSLPTTTSTSAAPTTSTTTRSTTTTSTTTTSTTTTTLPPIVIAFGGDTSFTHGLDRRDPFGEVTELLASPDLMLVNLETTIAERSVGSPLDKEFTFKSPPGAVNLLVDAGIDGVQLANNHIEDFRQPALRRTLELLDEGGVPHAGVGLNADSAYATWLFEVEGWTVGLVAFSRIPCGWARSGVNTRPEVAWTCSAFVEDTVRAVSMASKLADVVVVMVHWGIELSHCPERY